MATDPMTLSGQHLHTSTDAMKLAGEAEDTFDVTSSPPGPPASHRSSGQKERKATSITPRRFKRFFSRQSIGPSSEDPTRRVLFDITSSSNNRSASRSSPIRRPESDIENSPTFTRQLKRRKTTHTTANAKEIILEDAVVASSAAPYSLGGDVGLKSQDEPEHKKVSLVFPERRIEQAEDRGISGRLLYLNLGTSTRSNRARYMYPSSDYRDDTSRFYSTAEDMHTFNVHGREAEHATPFTVEPCNTNTMVAIGDDRGQIRLLDSRRNTTHDFHNIHKLLRPHENAIIDIAFTKDDTFLATACGDQTVKVLDVATQQVLNQFNGAGSSVKQVRWQPGSANSSILASSGRDGEINIYDLRCSSSDAVWGKPRCVGPGTPLGPCTANGQYPYLPNGARVNTIRFAHFARAGECGCCPQWSRRGTPVPSYCTVSSDVSVTSICFLPAGREHLLLSGSDNNASVKLWDIRSRGPSGRLDDTTKDIARPLSSTALPESHANWRRWGVTSIAVSEDGTRIYAPTRDSAVHVYATNKLLAGPMTAMNASSAARRPHMIQSQTGSSPIYSFRHPLLEIKSFYIQCRLRPALGNKPEMLAVGGSDSSAILFPTDERHLKTLEPEHSRYYDESIDNYNPQQTMQPKRRREKREMTKQREDNAEMIVSERGTALVEGHTREIGSVGWNSEGDLITVGDDYNVRIWRYGPGDEARSLRTCGNANGARWKCGWADVEPVYDEADDGDIED